MESLGAFLESQPFIALFLVIGLGYACGQVSVAGLSLGVGAVLFVGLAVGAIAPDSAPPGFLGTVGLVLFLYGIGIQYGRDFVEGLVSPFGVKANVLAIVAVVAGCAVAVLTANVMGFGMDFGAGALAGSLTSTASMQAAISAAGNSNPAVAYAITYPFGVFGPILCMFLFYRLLKPKIEMPQPNRLVAAENRAGEIGVTGRTVREFLPDIPEGVQLIMIRRAGMNMLPDPDLVLEVDDILRVTGLPEVVGKLRVADSDEVGRDRTHLDYEWVFISKPHFVGMKFGELPTPEDFSAKVVSVRRGDAELLPHPDVTIEYGDQVGVLVEPAFRDRVRAFFGDSVNAESQFSFVALGLGLVLGGLVGLIPIPIPGLGSITLGVAGGPLVVSLVLGYYGRLGPLNFYMPGVANVIMRNLGLTLFLAGVGMHSGAPFVENLAGAGLPIFVAGIVVLLTTVVTVFVLGHFVLRMRFDDLLGIAAGATGNPAILAYGNQLAPTGRPDVGYALIFPGVGTIVKVIAVQIIVALGASGVPPGG